MVFGGKQTCGLPGLPGGETKWVKKLHEKIGKNGIKLDKMGYLGLKNSAFIVGDVGSADIF